MLPNDMIINEILSVHKFFTNQKYWHSNNRSNYLAYHTVGSNEHHFNGKVLYIKTDTVLFLNTAIPYDVKNNTAHCIVISFNTVKPIEQPHCTYNACNNLNLKYDFEKLFTLWNTNENTRFHECLSVLYNLISKLNKLDSTDAAKSAASLYAGSAADYMRAHYMDSGLCVSDIAANLNISPQYLIRVFSSEYGVTPRDYLVQTRLNAVKELLYSTDYRISDISEMTGFNDPAYLSAAFKKAFDMSPINYKIKLCSQN